METKQNSRIRAWESCFYLFLLPTQRLLPALVFCSPWLALPPGIFGHRLFLEWAIFPPSQPWPSRECEILGCVSDKARRTISAGGWKMNDHVPRKLPFCVLFLCCCFFFWSVNAHIVSDGRLEGAKKKRKENTLHESVHGAVATEHFGFWRWGERNIISLV